MCSLMQCKGSAFCYLVKWCVAVKKGIPEASGGLWMDGWQWYTIVVAWSVVVCTGWGIGALVSTCTYVRKASPTREAGAAVEWNATGGPCTAGRVPSQLLRGVTALSAASKARPREGRTGPLVLVAVLVVRATTYLAMAGGHVRKCESLSIAPVSQRDFAPIRVLAGRLVAVSTRQ